MTNGFQELTPAEDTPPAEVRCLYRVRFRDNGQLFTAFAQKPGLRRDQMVMVSVEQGLEPAVVVGAAPLCARFGVGGKTTFTIERLASDSERNQYKNLVRQEGEAFRVCQAMISRHRLDMRLVRVERFFNGSKMIFYFTADNRVDFRELVKDLVQEFRTRVEMRQVGVRHETKMIGGIGSCGRELCCASFIKKFDSVSIKMAKEQDLPLNPTKISGLCNRLLCCLTYEYEGYRQLRKNMPKVGKKIKIGNELLRVKSQNPLRETIVVQSEDGAERQLSREQWQDCEMLRTDKPQKKERKSRESDQSDDSLSTE